MDGIRFCHLWVAILFLDTFILHILSSKEIIKNENDVKSPYVERKKRQDGFGALLSKLENIEKMLQKKNPPESEEYKQTVSEVEENEIDEKKTSETHMKEDFVILLKAFHEEKKRNERMRREIPSIKNEVLSLKTLVKDINESISKSLSRNEKVTDKLAEKIEESCANVKKETINIDAIKKIIESMNNIKVSVKILDVKQDICTELVRNISCHDYIDDKNIVILASNTTTPISEIITPTIPISTSISEGKKYQSCKQIYDSGERQNGVYVVSPEPGNISFSVYCDMKTDNGGWTVFQRRMDGSVDFIRDWSDYKNGFGHLQSEFWLGNDYIHLLTDQSACELRVDMEIPGEHIVFAKYKTFKVGPESVNYKLKVSGHSGSARDALSGHNEMEFSTPNRDNDIYKNGNCAQRHPGGWWFHVCDQSHLNGQYSTGNESHCEYGPAKCLHWFGWEPLKFTEMKLR